VQRLAGEVARAGPAIQRTAMRHRRARHDADQGDARCAVTRFGTARSVWISPGTTQLTVMPSLEEIVRERAVKPTRPALAVMTCARLRRAGVRGESADVDDRTAAARAQMRQCGLTAEKRTVEHALQDGAATFRA